MWEYFFKGKCMFHFAIKWLMDTLKNRCSVPLSILQNQTKFQSQSNLMLQMCALKTVGHITESEFPHCHVSFITQLLCKHLDQWDHEPRNKRDSVSSLMFNCFNQHQSSPLVEHFLAPPLNTKKSPILR